MLKINRIGFLSGILVAACLLFPAFLPDMFQSSLRAQNNTNSPYTRFGFGELSDRSFAGGRAMGGIGIGLRSPKQVNPLNPASYTAMDSLTFIFDFGAHAQLSWFDDGNNKQRNTNGNVEYMAMQFPISRRMAVSIGLLPYSHVGYRFGGEKTEDGLAYAENFIGSGGVSEVYGGLSADLWRKRLAVGVNAGYLFGNMDHQRNVSFGTGNAKNLVNTQHIEVRDLKLDFGAQYTHPLSKTDRLTFGAVYSPAKELNTSSYDQLQVGANTTGGYTEADTLMGQRFDLPASYGFGLSFVRDNKLTVGADFLYEEWSKAQFFGRSDSFQDRMRLAAGAEYTPDYVSRGYFKRVRYRAGLHYGNSYTNINMTDNNGVRSRYGYAEYGASVGFGFPLRTGYSTDDNRSFINIAFEYVKVKPEMRAMIDEQYLRFTLNFTFNEMWFYKLKMK
ncbi:Outer membrane protein transport protein (OMPP1/FadL/TodX) [Bacteroidales bacterium Barb7]|nr:Outer membrane protein transport protein (OMPP1/FadL/TodX) [Bacteroidales bacterium Barb7]